MKIALINLINATADVPTSIKELLGLSIDRKIQTDCETSIVELGKFLVNLGNQVTIFISDEYKPKFITHFPNLHIIYLPTKMKLIFPPAFIPFTPSLYSYIKKSDYDAILTVDFFTWGSILAIFGNIFKKKNYCLARFE